MALLNIVRWGYKPTNITRGPHIAGDVWPLAGSIAPEKKKKKKNTTPDTFQSVTCVWDMVGMGSDSRQPLVSDCWYSYV